MCPIVHPLSCRALVETSYMLYSLILYNLNQAILSNHLQPWELYLPIVSIRLWCPHGREAPSSGIALLSLPLLVPRNAFSTGTSRGAQPKD